MVAECVDMGEIFLKFVEAVKKALNEDLVQLKTGQSSCAKKFEMSQFNFLEEMDRGF